MILSHVPSKEYLPPSLVQPTLVYSTKGDKSLTWRSSGCS